MKYQHIISIISSLLFVACNNEYVPLDDVNWYDKPPTIEGYVNVYDQFGQDSPFNGDVIITIDDYNLFTKSNENGYWSIQVLDFDGNPNISISFSKSGYSSFKGEYYLERGFVEKVDSTINLYQIPTENVEIFNVERLININNNTPTDTILITTKIIPNAHSELERTLLLCMGDDIYVNYSNNINSYTYNTNSTSQSSPDTLKAFLKIPFTYFTNTLGKTSGSRIYFKTYLVSPLFENSGYLDRNTNTIRGLCIGNSSSTKDYIIP
jgi:hypothetical protein